MTHFVTSGSTRSDNGGNYGSRSFFVIDLIRRYGVRAVLALVVAALFAFAPLMVLYWFNELRFHTVTTVQPVGAVVVKPDRDRAERERDEPGETALLQVTCEILSFDGWRELLGDRDPARHHSDYHYVHRELVYLRRAGHPQAPFGLLGKPPVSAWLPEGNYEILVVHEAPGGEQRIAHWPNAVPWMSVFADCSLEARHKTVCRIQLPHYNWGNPDSLASIGDNGTAEERARAADQQASFFANCGHVTAIPTPGGYLLELREPRLIHAEEHRGCVIDFDDWQVVPREWTRDQIAALRNALPNDATLARARLSQLVDRLLWREFLQGWFCYAAVGITGLVFTRFGVIALVEPWRRGDAWSESLVLLVQIFFASVALWFLFQIMTDSSGCHGPVHFRLR